MMWTKPTNWVNKEELNLSVGLKLTNRTNKRTVFRCLFRENVWVMLLAVHSQRVFRENRKHKPFSSNTRRSEKAKLCSLNFYSCRFAVHCTSSFGFHSLFLRISEIMLAVVSMFQMAVKFSRQIWQLQNSFIRQFRCNCFALIFKIINFHLHFKWSWTITQRMINFLVQFELWTTK